MLKFLKTYQLQSGSGKVKTESPRRRRATVDRASLPLPEVKEGNTEADWELWADSVAAFDSQFPEMKDRFDNLDPFADLHKKKP